MNSTRKPFALRLPVSIHDQAERYADLEGTSLNQFIALALAEKLVRLESQTTQYTNVSDEEAPK